MGVIFMVLYLLIVASVIEAAVVLFNITGLKKRVSRFQVISMLTGTGFTTDESQVIIDHPIRRKLASFLILFGAFSLAVIISSISNIISNDLRIKELLILCILLFIVVGFLKRRFVQKKLEEKWQREMQKEYQLSDHPIRDVLYLDEEDLVTSLTVKETSPFIGKDIEDLIDKEDDIVILYIKRGETHIRKELYSTEISAGDEIYLYGSRKEIEEKFHNETV